MAQRRDKRKKRSKQNKDTHRGSESAITREGKDEYITCSYNVTFEPIKEMSERVPEVIKNRLSDLNQQIYDNPKEAISVLHILKDQYPDVPILYNFLALAYSQSGDLSAMDEICIENYAKNPDYLFAKINYANLCLHADDYKRIPEIFADKFDLKLLYPHRNEFHISEFEGFVAVMCVYYHKIGESDAATANYNALKKVSPDSKIFAHVKKVLYPGIWTRLMLKLFNKQPGSQLRA